MLAARREALTAVRAPVSAVRQRLIMPSLKPKLCEWHGRAHNRSWVRVGTAVRTGQLSECAKHAGSFDVARNVEAVRAWMRMA